MHILRTIAIKLNESAIRKNIISDNGMRKKEMKESNLFSLTFFIKFKYIGKKPTKA
jgi:hypothetical protein